MSVCGRVGSQTTPECVAKTSGVQVCSCGATGNECVCNDEETKAVTCFTQNSKLNCSWDGKQCEAPSCDRDEVLTLVCRKSEGANVQLNIVKKTPDTNKACVAITCKPKPVVTVTTTDATDEVDSSDSGEGSNSKEADPPAGACNESCRDLLATSYSHSLTQSDRLCLTHCLHLPADCTTRRTNDHATSHSCKKRSNKN